MEHTPESQKQFFEFAYQTGSDIWTHIPYHTVAQHMLPKLPDQALVLDIGAGRGLWVTKLIERGFRVLGMDYIESIVQEVNDTIKNYGYTHQARCIIGDALDIPFVDKGFDLVTDIGTFQHIRESDHAQYTNEVSRVLKTGGYYLNISLSKKTQNFMGFKPNTSHTGMFTKFGVLYHFYSESDIQNIFGDTFKIINQDFQRFDSQSDPGDDIVLIFTLMQKK